MRNDRPPDKIRRGNLAYQQRQQRRRNYLEKKRALRHTFELGKLVEKVQFKEELTILYGLLVDAKEKLQSVEAENIRQLWRIKGSGLRKEKF